MRRVIPAVLLALAALSVAVAPPAQAEPTIDVAIKSASFCDSGGNCITQRIWLQKTVINYTYWYRAQVQAWCSHSGTTIACRSISYDHAGLNHNTGYTTVFDYRLPNTTCTSSCGAVKHTAVGAFTYGDQGWSWLTSGSLTGCPQTGLQCGGVNYYDTGWRV